MKQPLERNKRKIVAGFLSCFFTCQMYLQNVCAASNIANSKLFTGTKDLFKDMQTPLITISGIVAVVLIIYNLIRMKMAEEMDAKIYKKKIFTIIGCAIGVVLAASLLTVILSYYK